MVQHYYTIETFYRKKWSDKYSLQYPTIEEAKESALHLFFNNEELGDPKDYYRIKELTIKETIHTL